MRRTRICHFLLTLLLTLAVSGCGYLDAPGPACVQATDFGEITTVSVSVDSKSNAWVDTNIVLPEDSNAQVQIEVQPGSILLCGKTENKAVNINSQNENWQDTGVRVRNGDQLSITVNEQQPGVYSGSAAGKYNRWGNDSDPLCANENGSNCWMYDGMGLNAKVGGWIGHDNCNKDGCSDGGVILPDGGTSVPVKGLYTHSGLPLDTSLITNTPSWTSTGLGSKLYLRVWDDEGRYNSDNEGGYVATITHYGCPRYNGENLRLYINNNDPTTSTSINDTLDLGPEASNFKTPTEVTTEGKLWIKIYDIGEYTNSSTPNPDNNKAPGDGYYPNNEGSYRIKVTVISSPEAVSGVISWLSSHLKDSLESAREAVYRNIITSQTARVARALLALYIIIYGIMFMYGMIQHTQMDFLIRVIKIGIIIQLTSTGSWDFFNEYLFKVFTDGSSYLIHVMSNAYTAGVTTWTPDQEIEWTFLDLTFSQLFSQTTWIKLAGLIFAFPIGWIYFILIAIAMAYYIVAVAWVILAYLLALIAVSLLIAVAPIFIICLLFEKTSDLFKKWLNQLFSYALQPVILVALLVIFNFFIVAALLRVLNFGTCWECLWSIDIGFDLCLWSFYIATSWDIHNPINSLPITIINILILFIFIKMLPKLISYAEKTAKQLSSAASTVSLTSAARGIRGAIGQKAKATVGRDKKSKAKRKSAKAGRKLHDRAERELREEDE